MMTDTWTWATVTQASPLRIKVDGDTTALNATTDNLVGSLAVDDRVRVHLHSDGIIVTGIQGGGNRSNPNLLINSNFMVNQEGNTSGASIADGVYFLDGWKALGATNAYVAWSGDVLTLGAPGSIRYARQLIDQANITAGTYTLSWEGDALGRVYEVGASGPSFAPSPIVAELTGSANVNCDFSGQGATVTKPKFERATVATPYQPPHYDDNLRKSMRYYQRYAASGVGYTPLTALGLSSTTGNSKVPVMFTNPIHHVPTLLYGGDLSWTDEGSISATVSSMTFDRATTIGGRLVVTHASEGVAYRPGFIRSASGTGWIAFDARL